MITKTKRIVSFLFALTILAAAMLAVATPARAYPTSGGINVPKIRQPKQFWCWAASGASIVKHIKGTNATPWTFAMDVQGNYQNVTRALIEVQPVFRNKHYIASSVYRNNPTLNWSLWTVEENSTMGFGTVANEIWRNRPIMVARLQMWHDDYGHNDFRGHAMVLCGYYETQGTKWVSLMDPESGRYVDMTFRSFRYNGDKFWGASLYGMKRV